MKDTNSNMIIKIWNEYIVQLNAGGGYSLRMPSREEDPEILNDEIGKNAILQAGNNKGADAEMVTTDVIHIMDEVGINILTKLVNKMYKTEKISKEMSKSLSISIAKKLEVTCHHYRIISLMSHT